VAAARRRIASRRNWPANLRVNGEGYYWFQHPSPPPGGQKSFGLGYDFKIACAEVKTLNAEMERRKGHVSLMQRVYGTVATLSTWCDTYEAERLTGNANTVVAMRSQIKAIKGAKFAMHNMMDIKPKEIADFVKECIEIRGATMASNIRNRLEEVFREAIAHGLVDVGANPVEAILKPDVIVTRSRLTLDDFKLMLAKSREDKERVWMTNAMELALVCGQRREDITAMRFDQIKDGFLWIEQSKGKEGNKTHLKIPLGLRLDAIDTSLEEILRRCRDNVVSKHVIHFVKRNGRAMPGGKVALSTMSQQFAKVRDDAEIVTPEGKTPTSLHEVRSLAARLYTEQYGKEFAQSLLGHKSSSMTDLYRDVRGREWTEIKLAGK
jgi:integrase